MNGMVKTSILLFASALALSVISVSSSTAKTMDLGLGIPKNLSDSVTRLKEVLPKKILDDIKAAPENGIWKFNSSVGAKIRNSWFYGHSRDQLAAWFFNKGIHHPDHMTGIILRALRADLNGSFFDLDKSVDTAKLGELRSRNIVAEVH
jgi:hypothetical protein